MRPSTLVHLLSCLLAAAAFAAACSDGDGGAGRTPGAPTGEPPPERPIVYEARTTSTTEVWTIDAKTGTSTQVTDYNKISGHPAWSPDYERIIFSSNRDGRRALYTVRPDGSDLIQLTEQADADHWAPKYSPDGKSITYVEVTDDDGSYLVLMNADGTGARRLTGQYRFAEFPAWTRDGKLIFYAAIENGRNNVDIYSVDPETLEVKTIVQTPSSDVCPHFSRDGNRLTYATAAADNPNNVDLFARDAPFDRHTDLGDDVRLTEDPSFDDYSNPSPDDATMVFLSRRDGNTELYLMDRDGGNERRLTFTPDLEENVPDW